VNKTPVIINNYTATRIYMRIKYMGNNIDEIFVVNNKIFVAWLSVFKRLPYQRSGNANDAITAITNKT
jgi:hypothetical protein